MIPREMIREVFRAVADFLYPPSCLLCGIAIPGEQPLCPECLNAAAECSFRFAPPRRSLDDAASVFALLPYDQTCRTLVHAFKYHNRPAVAFLAGNLMAKRFLHDLSAFSDAPLVPVPLHPDKLRSRGYNQASRLAEGFSAFSGHTVRDDLLARVVFTGTQTALDAVERRKNVHGAFRYTGETSLQGRPVILIDDVMTTGSTITECARALKYGGAGDIAVCVVATPDAGDD